MNSPSMRSVSAPWLRALVAASLAAAALPAHAIPAFARKYGTSCLTCHVVFPKLTPFGEAFRRNGYRFPGVDSDYVKQETVPLGQEANKKTFPNSVWPASIPGSVPISIGANGQAVIVPSKTSSAGAQGGNGAPAFSGLSLQDLVAEGHIWAGASLDDTITLWGELTFSTDGTVDVEHAQVLFNDVVGPKHLLNLVVGHGFPTITPFGPHSSYIADAMVTTVPVGGIYQSGIGNADPWTLVDNYTGVELNGVVAGRFEYSLGLNAGKFVSGIRVPTDNVYGHVGYKLGGMRLDGEGSAGAGDPLHPWAETALTLYAFAYRSNSRWNAGAAATPPTTAFANDVTSTFGAGLRGQLGSLELDAAYYRDEHNHGTDALGGVTAHVTFGELSYVLFPWMVPAIRVENVSLDPDGGTGVSDLHVMPGIAFLVRPNLRILVVGNWERASGFPSAGGAPVAWQGGSSDWGGFVNAPPAGAVGTETQSEFESFAIFLQWAM